MRNNHRTSLISMGLGKYDRCAIFGGHAPSLSGTNLFKCQKLARLLRHIVLKQGQTPKQQIPRTTAMKTNARFIKSITKSAAENNTVMPWARGKRRAAFIAKRNADKAQQAKAA